MDAGESGSGGGGSGSGGVANDGGLEEEKKKPPEGEFKVKRKMKTASQLELLEKTYAVDNYPSEAVRAELSVKLGLSDRQLQMWFCHRRLKDRKAPPPKRQRKDASMATEVGSSGGEGIQEGMTGEVGKEHALGSVPGSNSFGHVDLHQRVVARSGTAIARIAADMPAMKRYYEPPQAISELRAIAFVEAQLGEPIREDGPILGMEFDPLPPGAFGAPIVTSSQQKPIGRSFEARLYEHPDVKPIKAAGRTLHEYQFLPEQPSVRNETYERAVPSHYYGSSTDITGGRTSLSSGQPFMHAVEQVPSAYGVQGQGPGLSLLPQQGRQGLQLSPASGEYDVIPRKTPFIDTGMDAQSSAHPIASVDNPFFPSDRRISHDDDTVRMERKRKNEEARIAREVEAHERRIRKELEKQDVLRRKREEQMRKEMERQERERIKEEERLLREKQREEERFLRDQRREMERREKFLQKESIRAEKLRLKEEMRREKEAARLKAANDRAVARRIAKESLELIEDERLELMEIAASSKGLPSMLALDSETLESLDIFRDMQLVFPPNSVCLRRPFAIKPWIDSDESVGNLLMVWRFLMTFADVLGLWPFTLDEFVQAFHDYDSRLLCEIHVALLRSIIKDIEDVARTPSIGIGVNQNNAANPGGGHPHIVEGAYAWGFDICCWQRHLSPLTWPEILRQFALSAGFGPKLRKRNIDQARDENEDYDGEDIISNLRNGAAAENAVAIMQERGLSNPRRSRHRLTPGTVKFAAFHVLSLEGSKGLTILEVADKIQRSGLRDLTTSKTPEASIAAALSRDTKLFERTAPSTYCVRTPYRKDPNDAETILATAMEKIQVYTNVYFEGEDVDDVERDDAEREEDSDSDVADDPGVDELHTDLKPTKEADLSCVSKKSGLKTCMDNGKETLHPKGMETAQISFRDSGSNSVVIKSEGLVDAISIGVSSSLSALGNDITNPNQEDAVIDGSRPSEAWVQALTEGDYSDLSVDERLSALVALVSVANEGNSIRIVLEERLEAANALKKQIWAEAQLDKRRMKEEYVVKMQYSSCIGVKAEQNLASSLIEGRQSQSPTLVDKSYLASRTPLHEQEQLVNQQADLNYPNYVSSEKNLNLQEFPANAGTDNFPLQQSGFITDKSRSQLKAFISHKAEDMYVYRSLPLGQDRRRNRYWQFMASSSRNDPGCGRVFVELHDGFWRLIDSEEGFDALLASLDVRGVRESHLHSMLQMIEASFKETAKRNRVCAKVGRQIKHDTKGEVSTIAPDPDSRIGDSPSSSFCFSSVDVIEPSASFSIATGRDEVDKKDALMRYQYFEKWMWDIGYKSSVLHAMKFGKTRCKELLGLCNHCHNLYLFESNLYSSRGMYSTAARSINLNEHMFLCKEKFRRDPCWTSRCLDSSPPLRIRLLKANLAATEACIPSEALDTSWLEDYRKSWGIRLDAASSAESLLQILTLLEASIKRDFLCTNYETTDELLGSNNHHSVNDSLCKETVSVLPWVPHTTSAVALRLMELDAAIFYTPDQKIDSQKETRDGNLVMLSSKYAIVKNKPENESTVAPYEARDLQYGAWMDPVSGYPGSIRGRGRRGGRSRTRGGRLQKMVIGSRSEDQKSSRKTVVGFGQLPGWKGKARGRGRKRSCRSAGSRQKQMKRITNIAGDGHNLKDIVFEESPGISGQQDWNEEEIMPVPVQDTENVSSSEYDEDNGQASGYEYHNLMGEDYPSVFNGKSEGLQDVDYGVDVEDDDVEEEDDEDDDDILEIGDEEEQGDVDIDGYIIGDSDEENRGVVEEQNRNLDEDSRPSSSDYSD